MAISIPIFTAQLERAREATDAANLRSAYAEDMAAALLDNQTSTLPVSSVTEKQTVAGWMSGNVPDFPDNFDVDDPTGGGTWNLTYSYSDSLIAGINAAH